MIELELFFRTLSLFRCLKPHAKTATPPLAYRHG